jgi:hypothetical protein
MKGSSSISSSLRIISRTCRSPPSSFLIRLGLRLSSSSSITCLLLGDAGGPLGTARRVGEPGGPGVYVGIREGESVDPGLAVVGLAVVEAGISNHSSPPITLVLRKKGHSSQSITRLSIASASEMGTVEDLTTAVTTSLRSSALLFLAEVVANDPVPLVPAEEKSIHTASAIVPNLPRVHRLRSSSGPTILTTFFGI